MHSPGNNPVTGFWLFLVLQVIFVIIFAALGRYDHSLLPPQSTDLENETGEVVRQSKYPRKSTGGEITCTLTQCD